MQQKSRAEYFRRRRETLGQFMAMVDKNELARLDEALKSKGMTRAAWLRNCIANELADNEEV